MADVKDLFQIIAGKEVMIYDLKEALDKCQKEKTELTAKLASFEQQKPKKGNGKGADKPTVNESAGSTSGR